MEGEPECSPVTTGSSQLDNPSSINSDDGFFSELAVVSSIDGVQRCLADLVKLSAESGAEASEGCERFSATVQFRVDLICSKDTFSDLLTRLEGSAAPSSATATVVRDEQGSDHVQSPQHVVSETPRNGLDSSLRETHLNGNTAEADAEAAAAAAAGTGGLFEFFGQDQGTDVREIDSKLSPRGESNTKAELDREYDIDLAEFDILLRSSYSPAEVSARPVGKEPADSPVYLYQSSTTIVTQNGTASSAETSTSAALPLSITAAVSNSELAKQLAPHGDARISREELEREPMSGEVLRLKDEIKELSSSIETFLSPDFDPDASPSDRPRSLSPPPTRSFSPPLDHNAAPSATHSRISTSSPTPRVPYRDTIPPSDPTHLRGPAPSFLPRDSAGVPRPPCRTPEAPPAHPSAVQVASPGPGLPVPADRGERTSPSHSLFASESRRRRGASSSSSSSRLSPPPSEREPALSPSLKSTAAALAHASLRSLSQDAHSASTGTPAAAQLQLERFRADADSAARASLAASASGSPPPGSPGGRSSSPGRPREEEIRLLQSQLRRRSGGARAGSHSPLKNRPCRYLEMTQRERKMLSRAARQRREEEELERHCTFKPRISHRSKEILHQKTGGAKWSEPGDLAPIPRRQHLEEQTDLTLAPTLASGTKKIVREMERAGRRAGRIEDRLLEEGKASSQRKVLLSRTVQGLDLHGSYTPSVTGVVGAPEREGAGSAEGGAATTEERLHGQAGERAQRRRARQEAAVQREQAALGGVRFVSLNSRRILEASPHLALQQSLTSSISCQTPGAQPPSAPRSPSPPPRSALRGGRSASPGGAGRSLEELSRPKVREVSFGDVEVRALRDSSSVPMIARALVVQDMPGPWPYGPSQRIASPSQIRTMSLAPTRRAEGEAAAADAPRGERKSAGEEERKEVGGIGIQLTETSEGGFIIEGVTPDGPAALSNKVWVGDEVLSVGGVRLHGRGMAFAASLIQGAPGEPLRLSLLRRSFAPSTFAERRREFSVNLVRVAPPQAQPKQAAAVPVVPELGVADLPPPRDEPGPGPSGSAPVAPGPKFKSPRNHEPFHSPRQPLADPPGGLQGKPPLEGVAEAVPPMVGGGGSQGLGLGAWEAREGVSPQSGAPPSWYRSPPPAAVPAADQACEQGVGLEDSPQPLAGRGGGDSEAVEGGRRTGTTSAQGEGGVMTAYGQGSSLGRKGVVAVPKGVIVGGSRGAR